MILDTAGAPMPPPKDIYSDKRLTMTVPKQTRASNEFSDRPPAYSDHLATSIEQLPQGSTFFPNYHALDGSGSPDPTAHQVHVFERHHHINGTFYIDPSLKSLESRKGRHKSKKDQPHASFRSRKGSIDVELATTGEITKASKANISVSSHSGNIKITVLPMAPSRPRMGLDVRSHHGNVVMFLPDSYCGVVGLKSRKGEVKVLPELAALIKIVKSSDRDTIFMMGTQNNVYELDNTREASFCEVNVRHGDVILGLSGRDHYSPPVSFWKRLGGYLTGSSTVGES